MAPRRKFDFKFKEMVLQYAETHSSEKTARHFNIDTKRIRYWRKQRGELLLADRSRARLTGGGRKKVSLELEGRLSEWIYSMRDKQNRVSRSMIKRKALEIYPSVRDGGPVFVASTGWLQRFLQRNDLPLRRRSPMTQTDPDLLTEKLVSFVDHVGKAVSSQGILERDIIAMDETTVWFDMEPPTTTDTRDAKSLKTTGRQDSHLTVVLSARADGTKLKPYIVFRGAAGGGKARPSQVSGAVISTSVNGWMNDALTADWLQAVVGKVSSTPRLLVWDSYRCHIGAATKAELKRGYNITTAEIPGGCTKYIQAPDVMWNQPFKQSLQDAYRQWAAGGAGKRYTAGRAFRGPGRRLLVDWVVAAWDKLDTDVIRRSFKVCGLSVKSDGSEDDLILCFRESQPCAAGREALTRVRRRSQENRCQAAQKEEEEDEEELFNNELVVLDDDEEEETVDGEEGEGYFHQDLPSNDKEVMIKEEQQQQQWSPSLDQEDPPEPPHIKEEQEELWTGQEGEQLRGLEEADITKFTFSPVPVKSEEEEEEGSDVQQLSLVKEEVPPKDCSPSLDQEDPPEPPHIKEEQEELWTCQEGEQLRGLEEADITKFTFSRVPVKSEEEKEEKAQSSQLHQNQTEQVEKQGPEPARNSDPDTHLEPETEDSSETDDSDEDWTETREPQSGSKSHNNKVPVSDVAPAGGEKQLLLHSCSECGKRFGNKTSLKIHMRNHTGENSFSCLVCGKIFAQGANLRQHMAVHAGRERLSCSVCDRRFTWYKQFTTHKCAGPVPSQHHPNQTGNRRTRTSQELL